MYKVWESVFAVRSCTGIYGRSGVLRNEVEGWIWQKGGGSLVFGIGIWYEIPL